MSSKITQKTLNDLEFFSVLNHISSYCENGLAMESMLKTVPIEQHVKLKTALYRTNEYLSSFESENKIASCHFEEITSAIKFLGIEGAYIAPQEFLKISAICSAIKEYISFFTKFKDYFPNLAEFTQTIEYEAEILLAVSKIINRFGEVQNNASDALRIIRKELSSVRAKLSTSFNKALNHYAGYDILDDIRESILDNQRVLAVQAKNRKKVKGTILGTSKTGSIVFIAPEATVTLTRELQNLVFEEQEEIVKVLKALSDRIRPFTPLLTTYQSYLVELDVIAAKAKYARSINALLPNLSTSKKVFLKDAYHPLLLESNRTKGLETIPQTLTLTDKQQIIVISGPNAGGKSITLKTIGLLQVMIQSGILIPVHERSEVYFFDTILTDIGDNQSIENQLSTYSYRLKNMRTFLKKCNANTLFLIDEFGTGSDPELGGALAEIFLEEFYNKGAYGVITTHYSNLKVLADELENVTNGNMQFDQRTLEPLFKLLVGQAGSSFTFEVAQKNGIPYSLINRAKKKVEGEKLRLDKTISKLQKERNVLRENSINLEKEQDSAKEQSANLELKEKKIQDKLDRFQDLFEHSQKMLSLGRKLNELSNAYFQSNNKKKLLADFMKWITIEKSKYSKAHQTVKKEIKTKPVKKTPKDAAIKHIEKEVLSALKKRSASSKKNKEKTKIPIKKHIFMMNDKVRLIDGKAVGTIDKIEKNTATVNYGIFTTQVNIGQLELVQAAKS